MSFGVVAVAKAGHRHVLAHGRRFAVLAAPLWMATLGLERTMAYGEQAPARALAFPFGVMLLWFTLPFLITLYRSLPEAPEAPRLEGFFRIGRRELRLALYCLALILPCVLAVVLVNVAVFLKEEVLVLAAVPLVLLSLYLSIRLVPAFVAAARDQAKPLSLGWRLSKGRFWKIVLVLLLPATLFGLLNLGVSLLFGAVDTVATLLRLPAEAATVAATVRAVLTATFSTAATVWYAVTMSAIYNRLGDLGDEAAP